MTENTDAESEPRSAETSAHPDEPPLAGNLGGDIARRLRRPGPPLGTLRPSGVGSIASSALRFASSTGRAVPLRRLLHGPGDVRVRRIGEADTRPPRWWTPPAVEAAGEATSPIARTARTGGARAQPAVARIEDVDLPSRALPRAVRRVPDEQTWTPGGIVENLTSTVVQVRRMDEVTAAGPMVNRQDAARLSAPRRVQRDVAVPGSSGSAQSANGATVAPRASAQSTSQPVSPSSAGTSLSSAGRSGAGPSGAGRSGAGPSGAGPSGAGPAGSGSSGAGSSGVGPSSSGPSAGGVSTSAVTPSAISQSAASRSGSPSIRADTSVASGSSVAVARPERGGSPATSFGFQRAAAVSHFATVRRAALSASLAAQSASAQSVLTQSALTQSVPAKAAPRQPVDAAGSAYQPTYRRGYGSTLQSHSTAQSQSPASAEFAPSPSAPASLASTRSAAMTRPAQIGLRRLTQRGHLSARLPSVVGQSSGGQPVLPKPSSNLPTQLSEARISSAVPTGETVNPLADNGEPVMRRSLFVRPDRAAVSTTSPASSPTRAPSAASSAAVSNPADQLRSDSAHASASAPGSSPASTGSAAAASQARAAAPSIAMVARTFALPRSVTTAAQAAADGAAGIGQRTTSAAPGQAPQQGPAVSGDSAGTVRTLRRATSVADDIRPVGSSATRPVAPNAAAGRAASPGRVPAADGLVRPTAGRHRDIDTPATVTPLRSAATGSAGAGVSGSPSTFDPVLRRSVSPASVADVRAGRVGVGQAGRGQAGVGMAGVGSVGVGRSAMPHPAFGPEPSSTSSTADASIGHRAAAAQRAVAEQHAAAGKSIAAAQPQSTIAAITRGIRSGPASEIHPAMAIHRLPLTAPVAMGARAAVEGSHARRVDTQTVAPAGKARADMSRAPVASGAPGSPAPVSSSYAGSRATIGAPATSAGLASAFGAPQPIRTNALPGGNSAPMAAVASTVQARAVDRVGGRAAVAASSARSVQATRTSPNSTALRRLPVDSSTNASRYVVAPPRVSLRQAPNGPAAPPVPAVAAQSSTTPVRRSLVEATADLFRGADRGSGAEALTAFLRRSTAAGAMGKATSSTERSSSAPQSGSGTMAELDAPGTEVARRLTSGGWLSSSGGDHGGPMAPQTSMIPDSRLSGAELEELVDQVVDRIEQRVVDELERRGRHRIPGGF
ncbi:hypothetical protein ACSMXN_23445 [Jatrophihabitans sp. DSM 45814]